MMKKKQQHQSGSIPKELPRQKKLGTSSLQISEHDSSHLVGSIVEKGITENGPVVPTSVPRLTVLPFPVARHRSDGPHWVPRSIQSVNNHGEQMEENSEDEDIMGFDPIAAFANPVKKKEKRGLDFSSWREIVTGDDPSSSLKKKVNKHVETIKEGKTPGVAKDPENTNSLLLTNGAALQLDKVAISQDMDMDMDMENGGHLLYEGKSNDLIMPSQSWEPITRLKKPLYPEASKDERNQTTSLSQTTFNFTSKEVEDTRFSTSMESEIDAENRALLQRMTDDEIAEARAEILEKTKPSLIEALRKRGKDKLKSSRNSNSNMAASRSLGDDMQDGACENGSHLRNDISSQETMPGSVTTRQVLASMKVSNTEVKVAQKVQDSRQGSSNLWGDWNRRVEAVRELRFSLDGDVTDFVQELKTGASNQSGYTAVNVSERDFLRTEGDPAAAGYTIKEAVALTRSVVPGQRALALHLLASLLSRALCNLFQSKILGSKGNAEISSLTDWEAIWAYTLGPEPELVLSMRICLDDNHNSVVLGCIKVIHYMLSCYINEKYFDISEKLESCPKDLYTAPVFRRRPEVDLGFLHGGFWKYSTKPSNMLPLGDDNVNGEPEGEHTIKDDVNIAGQDVAAGFIRMGILPRLSYLLEANPSAALEEYIISILIAIARHSPVSTNTIMHHTRLVTVLVERFMNKDLMEISPSKIKSITLLRILARSNKKYCIQYLNDGTFQNVTWHLCRPITYMEHWIKSGHDNCKLSSWLMVEELRFWKVFLQYGNCASYFSDFFPAICIWLNIPTFEKLIESNLLDEYAAITREAFLVLAVLTRRLPNFYSHNNQEAASGKEDVDDWCWIHVGPMVDLAMKWIEFLKDTDYTSIIHKSGGSSLLWVISAVLYFLSGVLERVIPDNTACFAGGHLPYLPDFIPRIGLGLVKNQFSFSSTADHSDYATDPDTTNSYIEYLCYLRKQGQDEMSLASVCCLTGVVQVVTFVKRLIHLAKPGIPLRDNMTLPDQILNSALSELRSVLNTFMELISPEWDFVQSVETFGRAGPVPGVGLGWGATKGGFWSDHALRAQTDATLVVNLLDVFKITFDMDFPTQDEHFTTQWIVSALELCLTVMPKSGFVVGKVFDLLFQVPVLKYLGSCIRGFIHPNKQPKSIMELKEEDYLVFSKTLASHFKKRWLGMKRKKSVDREGNSQKKNKKVGETLDTIHEDCDMIGPEQQCASLAVEWAHQRLPLPVHWFLSAISTANDSKSYIPVSSGTMNLDQGETSDLLEVSKSGLFFLLGLEAISSLASSVIRSPVNRVPIVWKMHSLSVLLFDIGVQEEEKGRFMYKELQDVYGQILDKSRLDREETIITNELLKFQSEIQDSYDTFLEDFVDQFSAVSYGDEIYGRQLAIYLHRCVEAPVRLSAWTILSNAHVLELLPPLENCIAEAEGYLEPPEEDEKILEAYLKSWESGNLDRAVTRGSLAYRLVLHHLSSFIFFSTKDDKLTTRHKLARSLLRDYSRKQQHEVMMINFVGYQPSRMADSSLGEDGFGKRFEILREACEGNSSLLREVEKLRLACHENVACENN